MTDLDERLARLELATRGLEPPATLRGRVLEAVSREPSRAEPLAARRVTLGVFTLAAAAAVLLSIGAERGLDSQALSSFDTVELEQ